MAGSGLFTTFGYGQEPEYGTYEAPGTFLWAHKEAGKGIQNFVQSKPLTGSEFDMASRRAYVSKEATQSFDLDLEDGNLGGLFLNMLGAVSGSGTTVLTQVYTPADLTGTSLSVQIGRASTNDTTIQPVSYLGCKVTDWTVACKNSEIATFNVTFDSQQESVSEDYTAPSYVADNVLQSATCSLLLGGTVSTAGGITTVGGSPAAVDLSTTVSLKVANSLDVKRFYLGSILKQEPIPSDTRQITGSLGLDFAGLTTVYDAYAADLSSVLQINFVGPVIGAGTNSGVSILIPSLWFDEDQFPAAGPGIVKETVTFKGLDDMINNPVQLTYVTLSPTPVV